MGSPAMSRGSAAVLACWLAVALAGSAGAIVFVGSSSGCCDRDGYCEGLRRSSAATRPASTPGSSRPGRATGWSTPRSPSTSISSAATPAPRGRARSRARAASDSRRVEAARSSICPPWARDRGRRGRRRDVRDRLRSGPAGPPLRIGRGQHHPRSALRRAADARPRGRARHPGADPAHGGGQRRGRRHLGRSRRLVHRGRGWHLERRARRRRGARRGRQADPRRHDHQRVGLRLGGGAGAGRSGGRRRRPRGARIAGRRGTPESGVLVDLVAPGHGGSFVRRSPRRLSLEAPGAPSAHGEVARARAGGRRRPRATDRTTERSTLPPACGPTGARRRRRVRSHRSVVALLRLVLSVPTRATRARCRQRSVRSPPPARSSCAR